MECYCTCIIESLSYFFILQSLTTSKMRKFQTFKLSQFHKEKTWWTENWWSSGIMSNFWGEFFYVFGGKKNFENFVKNILATALKSYIKWLLYIFLIKKFEKVEKTGIISTKFSLQCTPSVILGLSEYVINKLVLNLVWSKSGNCNSPCPTGSAGPELINFHETIWQDNASNNSL